MRNKKEIEEIIYSHERGRYKNISILSLLRGISDKWELIQKILVRDISARYRQSFLGYFWALILPLVALGVFTIVSKYRILPMGQLNMPYVLFGVWSLSVWQLFSGVVVLCTNSLSSAGPLVTRMNFPKDILVLSSIGQVVIEFVIRVFFVLVLFVLLGFTPGPYIVFIPFIILSILFLSVGFGFFLSVLNLLLRDIRHLVSLMMVAGIFLTPVFYPAPVTWPFTIVNYINPLSPLLIATQDMISGNSLSHPNLFIFSLIFSFVVFFTGWKFFHYVLPRAIERA